MQCKAPPPNAVPGEVPRQLMLRLPIASHFCLGRFATAHAGTRFPIGPSEAAPLASSATTPSGTSRTKLRSSRGRRRSKPQSVSRGASAGRGAARARWRPPKKPRLRSPPRIVPMHLVRILVTPAAVLITLRPLLSAERCALETLCTLRKR